MEVFHFFLSILNFSSGFYDLNPKKHLPILNDPQPHTQPVRIQHGQGIVQTTANLLSLNENQEHTSIFTNEPTKFLIECVFELLTLQSNSLPLFPGKSDLDQLHLIMMSCGELCMKHQIIFEKTSSFNKFRRKMAAGRSDLSCAKSLPLASHI